MNQVICIQHSPTVACVKYCIYSIRLPISLHRKEILIKPRPGSKYVLVLQFSPYITIILSAYLIQCSLDLASQQ